MAVLANAVSTTETLRDPGVLPAGAAQAYSEFLRDPGVLPTGAIAYAEWKAGSTPHATYSGLTLADIDYPGRKHYKDSGRDDTDGSTATGCFLMSAYGSLSWPVAVDAGARTITVAVKQPTVGATRATLDIQANTDVGLSANVVATAIVGTGWQTLTCSFTATGAGAVKVVLRNNSVHACKFDDLSVE